MSKDKLENNGFAVSCSDDGTVTEILYQNAEIAGKAKTGNTWLSLIDMDSYEKGGLFFNEIIAKDAVFDWELNIETESGLSSFHFAGIKNNGSVLIVAAQTSREATRLLEEFTRMGNEQTNVLRSALKENINLRSRVENDSRLYDEISRLNNELVNVRRKLTKSNAELEQLNSFKNRMLGVAAHDLRNPLATILLLTEVLTDDSGNLNSKQIEYIQHITQVSNFMLTLIEDLLDVSVIEDGKVDLHLEDVDLVKLIQSAVYFNSRLAEKKGISITFDTQLQSVPLIIDRSKIEQVLNNLLSNGIKYSHKGGSISVTLSADNENYVCSVKDNGIGIKEEEIAKMFSPFYKTSNKATAGESQTGLGLYIVKQIVEAHNGTIFIESIYGNGSTFTFTLPSRVSL